MPRKRRSVRPLSHLDHSGQASWLIVVISFLYGVFHAAKDVFQYLHAIFFVMQMARSKGHSAIMKMGVNASSLSIPLDAGFLSRFAGRRLAIVEAL